jgi:ankyrin repeat protein/ubiquinone/menaquinone biosynthesis C-methylase UbiE
MKRSENNEKFVFAAQKGDLATVKSLFNEGVNIDATANITADTPRGRIYIAGTAALHEAAANGHISVIEFLIKNGATIDKTTQEGWTPLHAATFNGKTDAAEILVKKGANIYARDKNGYTPLDGARNNGFGYIAANIVNIWNEMKLVNKFDTSLNLNASEKKLSAKDFIEAAKKGNLAAVKDFVESGGDINAKSDLSLEGPFLVAPSKTIYNATAFIAACAYGHVEVAKYLASKGANVKYTNEEGYNAAHVAAFNGFHEAVIYLAEELNFNLSQNDRAGFNVIQAAAGGHINRRENCFSILNQLDNEIFQGKKYINHDFGLMLAVEEKNLDAVKYLVRHGHDFNAEIQGGGYSAGRFQGFNAYTYAKECGAKEIISFFDGLRAKQAAAEKESKSLSHSLNGFTFKEVKKALEQNNALKLSDVFLEIDSVREQYEKLTKASDDNSQLDGKTKAKHKKFLSDCLDSYFMTFYMCNGGLNGRTTEYFTLFEQDYTPNNKDLLGKPIPDIDRWYLTQTPPPLSYRNYVMNNWLPFMNSYLENVAERNQGKDVVVRMLSVSCGTMYDVMLIKEPKNVKVEIIGLDLDKESLKLAAKKAKKHGKEITTLEQDATKLEVNEPIDVISCNGFSFYVDDKTLTAIFKKFNEILKDGGMAVVNYIQEAKDWQTQGKFDPQVMDRFGAMMGSIPRKWSANFRSDDKMKSLAKEAGVAEEKVSFKELVDSKYNMHSGMVIRK